MATEFFAEAGNSIALTITPGEAGVLQVFAGGDKIFDKVEVGGHPFFTRVKAMRAAIREKLSVGADAD